MILVCGFAHSIICSENQNKQLHQLRRLKVEYHQGKPAATAIDFKANTRDQYHEQQHNANDKQKREQVCH